MADGFRRAVKCRSRPIRSTVLSVPAENGTKNDLYGTRKAWLILFGTCSQVRLGSEPG